MISPAELIRAILITALDDPSIAVVVGPATDAQQQAGVVQMVDSGMPVVELYAPVITTRVQMRCLAGTLKRADQVARTVQSVLTGTGRTLATQADGYAYLLHYVNVDAGPSMHYDSPETWETLMFASAMIGTEPVITPDP